MERDTRTDLGVGKGDEVVVVKRRRGEGEEGGVQSVIFD